MTGPRAVLVGPPGAGKTTVGRLLAEALCCPFRDTDADVEHTVGMSVADLFVTRGEADFRDREAAAVAAALAEHRGVLSVGGGAVLRRETRSLLAGHEVVFLSVGLGDAATRVGLSRDRPVLAVNPRAVLRVLLAERLPFYTEVARYTVDTTGRSPAEVLVEVLAQMALPG